MKDKKNEPTSTSTFFSKVGIWVGIIAGIFTVLNIINNIINNPNEWEWALTVILAAFTLGGWSVAGYFSYKNRKKAKTSKYKSLYLSSEGDKRKTDYIYDWFDDYIKSGEGHEYMKSIGNNEEQEFKIKQMHDSLAELREKNDTGYLESKLYYLYIFALLHGASKRVWAVSMGGEWIDSPEEKEFLRMNFEVAKRQIEFERFFVISKLELSSFLSYAPVLEQIEFRNSFFKTYIAFKEDLDAESPDIYRALGQGFLAFDDFAVADDRFQNDVARGYIFTGQDICKDFSLKFSKLRDFAYPLNATFLEKCKNME